MQGTDFEQVDLSMSGKVDPDIAAMNMTLSLYHNGTPEEKDANIKQNIKNMIEFYRLDEPGNEDLKDQILNKALLTAQMSSSSFDVNAPKTDHFASFSNALEKASVAMPSRHSDIAEINKIRSQSQNNLDYIKQVQEKFSENTQLMSDFLQKQVQSLMLDPESYLYTLEEYAKLGTDQQFLSRLLTSQIINRVNFRNQDITAMQLDITDIILKYYDKDYKLDGVDNLVCNAALQSKNSKRSAQNSGSFESGGEFGGEFGSEFDPDNFRKSLMESAARTIHEYTKLGFSLNTKCSNGENAQDIIMELVNSGDFPREYFEELFPAEISAPCVTVDGNFDLVSFCDLGKVLYSLHNELNRAEKTVGELKEVDVVNIYSTEHSSCTISMFDRHIKNINKVDQREITIELSVKGVKEEFSLTAKDRKKFFEELEMRIKR